MRLSRSSTTRVRTPCSPRKLARVSPTGPPPTMMTSGLAPAVRSNVSATSAPQQEVHVEPVECLGVLVLWPVPAARHHLEPGAGNHRRDSLALGDVGRRIVACPHDERRRGDRTIIVRP